MENSSRNLPAVLPPGNSGILSGIGENFAFHASPETFLANVVRQHFEKSGSTQQSRTPVRAKILNRNVAIVSSYKHVNHVLSDINTMQAAAPYMQLMEPFFPIPNLLLTDGCPHAPIRARWQPLADLLSDDSDRLLDIADGYFETVSIESPCSLYDSMKDLSWRIVLGLFLDLTPKDSLYPKIVALQEDLLRGQFSLFPVAFSLGVWNSPRKVGIEAKKSLQQIIRSSISTERPPWLSHDIFATYPDETLNHILMFTSSLAVKSLAALLTALFLNMSRLGFSKQLNIEGILQETTRLSPPIVGVMRRASSDIILPAENNGPDTLIPKGWDVWCYFPGANRDIAAYGANAEKFDEQRFAANAAVPRPFVFGAGSKRCLGSDIMMSAGRAVVKALRNRDLYIEATTNETGVRGWLGWEIAALSDWARDMKQLPTQRPTEPITALFRRYTPS